jgi:hypothetical protein
MFCNKVIPDDFVSTNMTKSFYASYSRHKYGQLFTREKSLLPETQERAEREKTARNFEKEIPEKQNQVDSIKLKMQPLVTQLWSLQTQLENSDDKKNRKLIKTNIKDKKAEIKTEKMDLTLLVHQISSTRARIHMLRAPPRRVVDKSEKEPKKYTRSCPDGDCRGFLSSAYKCGTCEKYFCSDCHIVKSSRDDKEHMCDEDIKASVKMINLDSKPCPKCSSYIYRTEGCSLMWCVKCHTQFDWNTLEIKHGYNHNPEYFRYMRENGINVQRNPLEVAFNCDRMPGYFELANTLRRIHIHDNEWYEIYRHRLHIIATVMRSLPSRVEMVDCSDLRIGYLLSDYDEEKWERLYSAKMKKNEINHERYKVLDMYCNVIKDNFLNLMAEISIEAFETFKDSCFHIEKYADEQLLKINKKYNSKSKAYLNIRSM